MNEPGAAQELIITCRACIAEEAAVSFKKQPVILLYKICAWIWVHLYYKCDPTTGF